MSEMSKEFLRNYVKEQNFSNSTEVLTALKSLFKDVLQEALAAEFDDILGYEKMLLITQIIVEMVILKNYKFRIRTYYFGYY